MDFVGVLTAYIASLDHKKGLAAEAKRTGEQIKELRATIIEHMVRANVTTVDVNNGSETLQLSQRKQPARAPTRDELFERIVAAVGSPERAKEILRKEPSSGTAPTLIRKKAKE